MKKRLFAVLGAVALLSGCFATTSSNNEYEDVDAQEASQQATEQSEAFVQNAKDRVFFGFDKSNLSAEAVKILKVQAEYLKANPEKQIVIEGHTDDRGTRDYNMGLGERRAVAVKNYLISRDVDADRIRVISYGKERPAMVGANESAWAQNRRAVTLVKD